MVSPQSSLRPLAVRERQPQNGMPSAQTRLVKRPDGRLYRANQAAMVSVVMILRAYAQGYGNIRVRVDRYAP